MQLRVLYWAGKQGNDIKLNDSWGVEAFQKLPR